MTLAPMTLTRIKRINSHVGYARFLAECTQDPAGDWARCIGVIPRQPDIPSPYRYSPEWNVYEWTTPQRVHVKYGAQVTLAVVIIETAHKQYDVFAVPASMVQHAAE